jgi:general secretion pathway protein L
MKVGEYFTWWRTELGGMLPEGLRRRFEGRFETLRLTQAGDELRIGRGDGGRVEELGRVDMALPEAGERVRAVVDGLEAGSTRVEVVVPPEKLLVKQIQLPLAAEENLRQVLGFEMQRQTPFRAEQVYFNFRVLARRPGSQQLDVRLSVVPRTVVESVLGLLAGWDLVQGPGAGASSSEQGEGDDGVFVFVPDDGGQRQSSGLQRVLMAANIVLLVAVIAIPLVQQRQVLDGLRERLAEVRAAATTASNLQQRIDEHEARSRYLFDRKSGRPASVELLEELSRRLPDDTWLFRAEIRDGKVHLQGTSTRASALIAGLEASGFLEDVRFASPVTQDGASGRERFHLSAAIVAPGARALAGSPEAESEGRDS